MKSVTSAVGLTPLGKYDRTTANIRIIALTVEREGRCFLGKPQLHIYNLPMFQANSASPLIRLLNDTAEEETHPRNGKKRKQLTSYYKYRN